MYVQHYLKNDLKYKQSGATGKLGGVVSIDDITVYYGSNSTAMSAARISTTILESMYHGSTMVHVYYADNAHYHMVVSPLHLSACISSRF